MGANPSTFGELKAPAAAELARQIDSLEPNASALHAVGFGWLPAVCLATAIGRGEPDIGELRAHGLDLKAAVGICTAIAARHAPAPEPEPLPVVLPPLPYAEPVVNDPPRGAWMHPITLGPAPAAVPQHQEPVGDLMALSLLHTLATQIETGRADPTDLVRQGFTQHSAEEITNLIRCAHPNGVSQ